MSIIPASCLSASELASLGNNLRPVAHRNQPRQRQIRALNRSLAIHHERVGRLYSRPISVQDWSPVSVAR
jgi:hypothetical protein